MHEIPTIILIARCSSSNVPKDWYAGYETLEEGLPRWGASRLAEFRKVFPDDRPALLIVGIGVKTACTPTPEGIRDLPAETSSAKTSNWRRAHRFTTEITKAMNACVDRRPTLISIGADGFSCNSALMKPFLERMSGFDLAVRHHTLGFPNGEGPGLTEALLSQHEKHWWGQYKSEDIQEHFHGSPLIGSSAKTKELVTWWDNLQLRKNMQSDFHLLPGRNTC